MRHKYSSAAAALAAVLAGAGLLFFSEQALQGIRQGLTLCGQTLIPSLFPFMVLALFVSRSRAAPFFCRLLQPLCRRWLRLPAVFGPVLLMSLIGGYPVGARMLSGMLQRKEVTAEDAGYFLRFGVCPAPSYAVVTVGAGLLGSAGAGAVLYCCHVFTGLLLGGWQARRRKTPKVNAAPLPVPLPFGRALVEATAAGVEGMLSICGFVLLFSVVLSLLQLPWGLPLLAKAIERLSASAVSAKAVGAALCGLLEVTCGIFACRGLGWGSISILVPFLVSFGSVSVLCQISASLGSHPIAMTQLLGGRLLHAMLATLMAAPLISRMQPALGVMVQAVRPLAQPNSIFSTIALLGMCSLFLLHLQEIPPSAPSKKKQ